MNITVTHPLMKKPILAASLALCVFATTCVAQSSIITTIQRTNADWHDPSSWKDDVVPSQENELAIINGGHSGIVDQPFEAPISVQVGNGESPPPDGTLTIYADFQVKNLSVATHTATSGKVEQFGGVVSLEDLNLASIGPDAFEAVYDLVGGTLLADTLKAGVSGPATLSIAGSGEVVTVNSLLLAGAQSALRFTGDKVGFPTLNAAAADITIESGATLTVEFAGPDSKPGKFTLIQADQPLATSFKVDLVGFGEGKAKLLESEPGIVLEVK
jgi:hypothetical protein